jgi:hypothetical protein
MIAQNPKFDLTTLGAVFNDDDYAFSSAAQAYLATTNIPGTRTKFKEQQDALKNNTSSVVNEGWRNYNKVIEAMTQTLKENNPPYSPDKGYGKAILDTVKKSFIADMEKQNNLWYKAKTSPGFSDNQRDVISNLTIAANTPELWSDLAKQSRWHTVVDYLNFRYNVYDELKRRGTTIDSKQASDVRQAVDTYVFNLRNKDINFGKFYDRYFDGDKFDFVFEEPNMEGK